MTIDDWFTSTNVFAMRRSLWSSGTWMTTNRKLRLCSCAFFRQKRIAPEVSFRLDLYRAEGIADGLVSEVEMALDTLVKTTLLSSSSLDAFQAAMVWAETNGYLSALAESIRQTFWCPDHPLEVWNPAPKEYDSDFGDEVCHCGHEYHWHFDSYESMSSMGCKYCACRRFIGKPGWFTPQVQSLAEKAYEERGRKCRHCRGNGYSRSMEIYSSRWNLEDCDYCHGWGHQDHGQLLSENLQILADALLDDGFPETMECWECKGDGWHWTAKGTEEAWREGCDRCQETGSLPHPLLMHLRSKGPHYRGTWSLDKVLGKS